MVEHTLNRDPAPEAQCPVTHCVRVIGGKWKPVILFMIDKDVGRFGQMRRHLAGISKQMLTKQLRELEEDGVITRTVFAEVPPRVEYALTDRGRSLLPVIGAMRDWGEAHMVGRDVQEEGTA
ncbi:MAG: helix-turn-helix domain-containing protein [Pseudomonadota bacterium]